VSELPQYFAVTLKK